MTSGATRPLRLVDPGRAAILADPAARTAFVGRTVELERLDAAFNAAVAGHPTMVLVAGEAGIGKSRLVEQLAMHAHGRGALVAVGGCVPPAGGLPYGAIVALLRDLVQQTDDPATAEVLGRLVHDGATSTLRRSAKGATSVSTTRTLDGLAKTRLFESLLGCLSTMSAEHPMLLGFEDLHWADSATAEFIDFLMRNVAHERLVVVGTYRIEDVGPAHPLRPWLAELAREPRVSQLRVGGLARAEVAALIGGLVDSPPDWPMIEAVWSRSQGNPFYAEELTAAPATATLPDALRDLVLSRVEGLPLAARKVVGFASTAGTHVEHDLLAALSGLDSAALDAALVVAIQQQVLRVDGTGYRFRHALLREATYESLLPGERRRLHREIATLLETHATIGPIDPGQRISTVAGHWWAAGEWSRALRPSLDAADAAVALLAYPEAHEHLEHALASFERAPDASVDGAELTEKAASVAYRAGEDQRAVELARKAVELSELDRDPETMVRRLLLVAGVASYDNEELADAAIARCRAILPAGVASELMARVVLAEASTLMITSHSVDGLQRSREALTLAREVGARVVECKALNYLGCCLSNVGALDDGIAMLRESVAIAEDLADPDLLSFGYTNLSSWLLEGGRLEEAAVLVFDMAAVGEDMWGAKLSGAAGNSVEALIRLGRYHEARALLGEVTRGVQGTCAPAPFRLPCYIEIRMGRFEEATRLLGICDALTKAVDDLEQRGSYHRLRAELALEEGRPADAYDAAQDALRLAAGTDDQVLTSEVLAFAARAVADRVEVERQQRLGVDIAMALATADDLVAAMSSLLANHAVGAAPMPRTAAYAATLSAERSRLDRSDPLLWCIAVTAWEAAHEAYPLAYCLWRQAEALLEGRSGRSDAAACLARAWSIARSVEAAPLVARIERLATRARVELTESDPVEDGATHVGEELGLTPREVEVLGQLASGRTDREIAESLFISKKTASVHVSNVLRKLSVVNRVEAGRVGQAHGLTAV